MGVTVMSQPRSRSCVSRSAGSSGDFDDPVGGPVGGAPLDDGGCGAFDEFVWGAVVVVGEEDASLRCEGGVDEGPEGREPLGWDMREPAAHEDDVVAAVWPPGEEVGLDEPDGGAGGDAARGDGEHFRGGVDGGDVGGVAEQLGGPGAGAAGEVEDAAGRRKAPSALASSAPPGRSRRWSRYWGARAL